MYRKSRNGQQGRVAGLRFNSSEAYATHGSSRGLDPVTKILTMTGTNALASIITGTVLATSVPTVAVSIVALFAFSVILMRTPSLGATA